MQRFLGLLLAGSVLLSCGCLIRHDLIFLFPDGSAKLITAVKADMNDFKNGDAMPCTESGWQTKEQIKTKDNDKQEITLVATRALNAGEAFPTSYAPTGSRLERKALRFTTMTRIEHRKDGTYYHFRRIYHGRKMADIKHLRSKILESEDVKKLSEKDPDELTTQERKKLVEALIEFEREKTKVFIDQAAMSLGDALPQDAWLKAREQTRSAYEAEGLVEKTISLLETKDSGDELETIEQRVLEDVERAVEVALKTHGRSQSAIDRLLDVYRLLRETHEVTEDLDDDDFGVAVILPGKIVAHNSEETPKPVDEEFDEALDDDEFPEMGKAFLEVREQMGDHPFEAITWDFDGKDLYDRDVVLLATSFVPAATGK